MTRLSLQNRLSLSLSISKNDIGNKKKKKERKKETPPGLIEAAFVENEKHAKLYKRDYQGYGRLAPKESVNSVQMPFRKVLSLGSD